MLEVISGDWGLVSVLKCVQTHVLTAVADCCQTYSGVLCFWLAFTPCHIQHSSKLVVVEFFLSSLLSVTICFLHFHFSSALTWINIRKLVAFCSHGIFMVTWRWRWNWYKLIAIHSHTTVPEWNYVAQLPLITRCVIKYFFLLWLAICNGMICSWRSAVSVASAIAIAFHLRHSFNLATQKNVAKFNYKRVYRNRKNRWWKTGRWNTSCTGTIRSWNFPPGRSTKCKVNAVQTTAISSSSSHSKQHTANKRSEWTVAKK